MNKIKNYWKKKLDLIHWKKKPTKIFSFDPKKNLNGLMMVNLIYMKIV